MLIQMIKRWLMNDRVRISPTVGQTLMLEVGQRVIIDDSLMIISARQTISSDAGVGIRYHLIDIELADKELLLTEPPVLITEGDAVVTRQGKLSALMDCYL
jgi:hypothetical protein